MRTLKSFVATAALALGLVSAVNASNINVGGVIWDPDAPPDFKSTSGNVAQIPGVFPLSGWGRIDFINNLGQASFCPGCELTFTFTGYVPAAAGPPANFAGGVVNVYVDSTPDFDIGNQATAADGVLWLSLAGHIIPGQASPFATLLVTVFPGVGANANGLLDVVGGLAAGNFDTDTQLDGADFNFQNTFFAPNFTTGSGNFFGDSIPEPGILGLMGLGFAGLGLFSRRRAA